MHLDREEPLTAVEMLLPDDSRQRHLARRSVPACDAI